jgi:hypothetical protein
MRLTDLMGRAVQDTDGHGYGKVHNVHLVEDGPPTALGRAEFQLHGLVVGRFAYATRLGYAGRPGMDLRGPAPLRWAIRRLHREARYVPWPAVVAVEAARIVVEAPPGGFERFAGSGKSESSSRS